jgi:16S rRNA (cytidine1402-2'-O)-methyltransferase
VDIETAQAKGHAAPVLYVVATPLGNLDDITARAREVLASAPVLAAEDTRSARRLLSAMGIGLEGRELLSYGEHNEREMAPLLIGRMQAGKTVALLSEGGTPLVSDPGFRLVRGAIDAGITVTPVPGPSAVTAALSASGLPVHGFIFRGFLPKKPGARGRILSSLRDREETLIFYESPQRVARLLAELAEVLGQDRPACVARELTKVHETFWRGSLVDLARRATEEEAAGRLKGEITVLVAGLSKQDVDD